MKLAFVSPRFGQEISAGAENLVFQIAERLQQKGYQVTALTTCAKDNRTWKNEYQPGEYEEAGVRIFRFLADERNLESWIPDQIKISQGLMLPIENQLNWMKESVNSKDLYQYILNNHNDFDLMFFAPYLFGLTFWGSQLVPEKSVLIPCLHDESYAYTDVLTSMFRQVKKCIFNAEAEKQLALKLYGELEGEAVGMGFDLLSEEEVASVEPYFQGPSRQSAIGNRLPKAESRKQNAECSPRYIFYIGRKETGKNLHLLIQYFLNFQEKYQSDIKLVIAGSGDFSDVWDPKILKERDDIIDVGKVSEAEKNSLIKYAEFICQPSVNESFSLVLMEAWQFKIPVLVHGNCAVTKEHVIESGGGLYFSNQKEFDLIVQKLLEDSALRQTMGQAGREYVKQKYNWDVVLSKFECTL